MDWYYVLFEYFLEKDYIDEFLELILFQLKVRIVVFYKVFFLYLIKSICFYYCYQGFVFFCGFVNWDDWDVVLKVVMDVEDVLQRDLDQYNKFQVKEVLG